MSNLFIVIISHASKRSKDLKAFLKCLEALICCFN